MPGLFLNRGLRPAHLERVGAFMARLHEHAASFVPPPGFTREPVGELPEAQLAETVRRLAAHATPADVDVVTRAAAEVRRIREANGGWPGGSGLIHGDLHQWNYLFQGDEVRAIDFDDCGVGPFLYDLAVTISSTRRHPRGPELRAALLSGYRSLRALPENVETCLDALVAQREIEGIIWRLRVATADPSASEWALAEVRENVRAARAFADAAYT